MTKQYEVKNAFYLNGVVQGAGKVIELDEDEFKRLQPKDVIGKEVVESKTLQTPPDELSPLEAFDALGADAQKEELARLKIEGDDSNKDKRVALFTAYINSSNKNNQEAGDPDAQTQTGETSGTGTGDAESGQGTT
jgi:hypothetical protein